MSDKEDLDALVNGEEPERATFDVVNENLKKLSEYVPLHECVIKWSMELHCPFLRLASGEKVPVNDAAGFAIKSGDLALAARHLGEPFVTMVPGASENSQQTVASEEMH